MKMVTRNCEIIGFSQIVWTLFLSVIWKDGNECKGIEEIKFKMLLSRKALL